METRDETSYLFQWIMKFGREAEWVEFKHNNSDPSMIGEYVSALSNAAAQQGKPNGYIIWGIEDQSLKEIGTNFRPDQQKIGNENLENWLIRKCNPRLRISFMTHHS